MARRYYSPRDLHVGPGLAAGLDLEQVGDVRVLWGFRPEFGPWLRRQRQRLGWSVRATAPKLGISNPYLSKLETNKWPGAPKLELLGAIAEVYDLDVREVLHQAGYVFEADEQTAAAIDRTVDERFANLVRHPALRQPGLTAPMLELIPTAVKHAWIRFAQDLEAYDGPESVSDMLRGTWRHGLPDR